MQRSTLISRSLIGLLFAVAGPVAGMGVARAAAAEGAVTGIWQHRQVDLNYYGMTTTYSCDGLENNIRALLLYIGARGDAKVSARGCPNGPTRPGRYANVHMDFYALSAGGDANTAGVVKAFWGPVEVSPTRPYFMGHGDCELLQQMKDLISNNFALQDLTYRTDCLPREVNIEDFTIKARVLKAAPPALADAAAR